MKVALRSLRGKDLARIATYTGLKSSGIKSALQTRLARELQVENFGNGTQRIVSIDMGIRNLAFCSIDIDTDLFPSLTKQLHQSQKAPKRQVADGRGEGYESIEDLIAAESAHVHILSAMKIRSWQHVDITKSSLGPDELYDPPTLAPIIYKLVKDELLPLEPDHILIERQRHRSGGQAAVLEWTFRVNMLESMLWSSLEAMRLDDLPVLNVHSNTTKKNLCVHAVLPSRVNALLLDGDEGGRVKAAEAKVRKTAQVEHWLRSGNLQCQPGQASNMRDSFLIAYKAGSRRASQRQMQAAAKVTDAHTDASDLMLQAKKLDDLADCISQAVAWVQWEMNRREILYQIDVDG